MKSIIYLLFSASLLLFSACTKKANCTDGKSLNYVAGVNVTDEYCVYPTLAIDISLKMGNDPFEINRIYNINGENTAFKVFQTYFSGISLVRSDQTIANYDSLYPLIKIGQTTIPLGQVFVEEFEYLRFNIGVDSVANGNLIYNLNDPNHPLTGQSPDTMHWNNGNGYIFLKLQGKVDRNGDGIPNANESFDMQIGTNSLLRSINLLINKRVDQEQDTIHLALDVLKLLNNVDLQTEEGTQSTDNFPLAAKIANNIPTAIRVL